VLALASSREPLDGAVEVSLIGCAFGVVATRVSLDDEATEAIIDALADDNEEKEEDDDDECAAAAEGSDAGVLIEVMELLRRADNGGESLMDRVNDGDCCELRIAEALALALESVLPGEVLELVVRVLVGGGTIGDAARRGEDAEEEEEEEETAEAAAATLEPFDGFSCFTASAALFKGETELLTDADADGGDGAADGADGGGAVEARAAPAPTVSSSSSDISSSSDSLSDSSSWPWTGTHFLL
jgi:hypothetical protein